MKAAYKSGTPKEEWDPIVACVALDDQVLLKMSGLTLWGISIQSAHEMQ